ncbi:hypothetical protein PoB_007207800 [Plakobranchus ocellatus]|uniref:Uncharacterized protein n=1 Tax=Plakobranchus ocellatus TaxID=259542 RepID=A0AAV4DMM4_9GAST|nr:hypothetical protein PoB_007207800 [Plakobranchus ocellatus]
MQRRTARICIIKENERKNCCPLSILNSKGKTSETVCSPISLLQTVAPHFYKPRTRSQVSRRCRITRQPLICRPGRAPKPPLVEEALTICRRKAL